jgi:uncharacterized lipoprotein YbaY
MGSGPADPPMNPFRSPQAVLLAGLLAAGCGHLDVTPHADPDRVLSGTVNLYNGPDTLPDDTVIIIRVVDAVPPKPAASTQADPTLRRPVPPPDMPPEVLGEKTIAHPGSAPVPFEVEYRAEAAQLEHGLNVEVRVSYGGRVRYLNQNRYSIGLNDADIPHAIWVGPVGR